MLACLAARGQAVDSLATADPGPAAQALSPPSAFGDTVAYGQFRNTRIGFNSYVYANTILARIRTKTNVSWAEGGQTFLYNKSLSNNKGQFVQQDYFLRGEQTFTLKPNLQAGQRLGAYAFTAIGNAFGRYEGFARWQPIFRKIRLFTEASGGAAFDKRGQQQDLGPSYGLRVVGTAISRDSLTAYNWQGQVAQAFISPRQMALFVGKAGLTQQVGGFAQTRITAGYLRRRVEDYFLGQIQQIVSDSLELEVMVGSQLGRHIQFQSDNRLLLPSRQFNYRAHDSGATAIQNTRFAQTEVYSHQELSTQGKYLRQSGWIELTERIRNYDLANNLNLATKELDRAVGSERIKNISENTVSYGYSAGLQLGKRSLIQGSYTGKLLRVNTPSDLNDQDRDETYYTGDLNWSHRWMRTLRTGLRLSGSERHVVFVKGTQSAQNYVERVIRLEPAISYNLGPVRLTSLFGVWATYNVRDFEQEASKNRANRIWLQNYTMRYQGPRGWFFSGEAIRRENRLALLNWHNFTESPIDTVIQTDLHGKVGRMLYLKKGGTQLTVQAGFKLFRQDRHYLAGVTETGKPTRQAALHAITLQNGPTAALVWELPGRGRISLDGWYQFATTVNRYQLSDEVFIGQTFSAADLSFVNYKEYFFFNLTGAVVLR